MKKLIAFLTAALLAAGVFAQKIPSYGTTNSASQFLENGKSKYVSIFAVNDIHGTIEEDLAGKNPGGAKLSEVIKELKLANPESIFVSAGDNYQGSALSNLSQGKIMSDFFKKVGLVTSAIGNHEFDWGDDLFAKWEADGGFNFVACNLIDKRTGKIPSWCKEYELCYIGGHLICIIGSATKDTVFTAAKKRIENFEFLDPAKCIRKVLRKVEATYSPEAVVVLSHIGSHMNRLSGTPVSASNDPTDKFELEDVAKLNGVAAIITGHSHEYVNGTINGKPIVQAYNYGRAISQIKLTFNEKGLKSAKGNVIEVFKNKDAITEDPEILSLVAEYKAKYGGQLGEKICQVEDELSHEETVPNVTPLGYTIASAMKSAYKTDFAVTNGGGLRKSVKAGTLTVNDMWELIPFDNTGVILTLKGKDLKKIVDHGINSVGFRAGQFAGGKVSYSSRQPEGSRVTRIVLDDGRTVNDNETYTCVVNDFMAEGGDKYTVISDGIKAGTISANNTYIPFRDAVIEQLKSWGAVRKGWSEIPQILFAE
ncbi:5'-nucleotidase C-terminal domain-containing protein [uncultured Treponema sp.]|uniref:bifunctional metallophosphatase/5'-nucleotidase n=1 Tax=uncultured Treponema sp. TaxID=162155 RepID=UPI0025F21B70|nr:5'-nucleotidase C-terminal domain-containing protein [uncultured Treponema sp.]